MREINYKDYLTKERLEKLREHYTPNSRHPYHGIKALHQLKTEPQSLRIGASNYLQMALQGKNTVENIRTVISFHLAAYYVEDLFAELTEAGFPEHYHW